MMAFRISRGGYTASASIDERNMMSSLARDVIYILGSDVERELERREELEHDDVFAALEAEMSGIEDYVESLDADDHEEPHDPDEPDFDQHMPFDDALERLLPDMSEDPQDAKELRKLTEESVAGAKIDNLTKFYNGLVSIPEGVEDVVVLNEDAPAWMSAMNDIRMVLAARLEISDDDRANEVFERAGLFTGTTMRKDSDLPEIETPEDMMAVLYAMTSWWQESLVGAVRNKTARR